VATVAWTFVMGVTGWYKDPTLAVAAFLPVVILLEIGLIWWGLRETAARNTYGQQVLAGTTMAIVAAVIIFIGSYLFTTVFFPNYFEELRAMQAELLRQQGLSEADIQSRVAAEQAMQTPLWHALFGVIGTVVTGVVASAIIAIFVRRQ
jgi:hypothetical protein